MRCNPYEGKLIPRAKALRQNMTPQERKLWYLFLRSYAPRFYRQRAIGKYIADFYCPAAQLAIEIDGSQHYEANTLQRDAERTNALGMLGISVLRFTNADINERFHAVCECIDRAVRERTPG